MKVSFVRLEKPEKAIHLCSLAESFYLRGARVFITVDDENQGITLDRFMWNWRKGSFLPHVYDNGAVECYNEPVVIGVAERNPNSATVLIMGRPCTTDFIRNFEQAIDFAELYDPDLATQSRARFASYRSSGFEACMLDRP